MSASIQTLRIGVWVDRRESESPLGITQDCDGPETVPVKGRDDYVSVSLERTVDGEKWMMDRVAMARVIAHLERWLANLPTDVRMSGADVPLVKEVRR